MGGLFISSVGSERALEVFEKQHAPALVCLHAGAYRVWVAGTWSGAPSCIAKSDTDAYLAVAGTIFYRNHWQESAARRLLQDLEADAVDEAALFGAYAIAYWDGGQLRLLTDWLGHLCVYRNGANSVWSTSFLATVESCERRTLNVQGAYEYLFQESTFGTDTICKQVERVESERTHNITCGLSERKSTPSVGSTSPIAHWPIRWIRFWPP